MSLKRKLTDVAVDSFVDYLREKLEKIKQLDLDQDGQKDVDQIAGLLKSLSAKVKDTVESTDFPKLATGLEQIMSGVNLIGSSIDREKLGSTFTELGVGMQQIGHLLELGVHEMKQIEKDLN